MALLPRSSRATRPRPVRCYAIVGESDPREAGVKSPLLRPVSHREGMPLPKKAPRRAEWCGREPEGTIPKQRKELWGRDGIEPPTPVLSVLPTVKNPSEIR